MGKAVGGTAMKKKATSAGPIGASSMEPVVKQTTPVTVTTGINTVAAPIIKTLSTLANPEVNQTMSESATSSIGRASGQFSLMEPVADPTTAAAFTAVTTVVAAVSTPVLTQTVSSSVITATSSLATVTAITDIVPQTTPTRVTMATEPTAVRAAPHTPAITPVNPARITTADIMTTLIRLEQKMDMMMHELTKVTADNVTMRHDLLVR